MTKPFVKPEDFFLGVLVGIYGNWLISFLDRVVFPVQKDYVFYIQLGLVMTSFLTFVFYLMFAYIKKYYPSAIWVVHSILPLITFIFQDSFIKHQPELLSKNIVFWTTGFPILCLIFIVEFISMGRYHEYLLRKRWNPPLKIGILNDMSWDLSNTEIYTWTNVPVQRWATLLNHFPKVKTELIDVETSFDRYTAILNPYGGVYPEMDLSDLSILNKILDFVEEGGIFINIADIPAYWAYSKKLSRKIDTTPQIYEIEENQIRVARPFELTPLAKQLGVRILRVDTMPQPQEFSRYSDSNVSIFSKRIALVESNMEPCLPTHSISTNIGEIETSAFFSVKYGEGDFVFSLIFINDEYHDEKAIETIINGITKKTIEKIFKRI